MATGLKADMDVRQFLLAVDGGKRQFAADGLQAFDQVEFQTVVSAANHAFEHGYVQSLAAEREFSSGAPLVSRFRVGSLTDAGKLYLDWE